MEDIFRLRDYGYEQLTELTLDGLLVPLTETTWVRSGAVLGPEDRISALAAQIPARLVVSHSTAWWVHVGLGRAPSPLTFTTHPRRRVLDQDGAVVHELNLGRGDWETIAGLPVTTPMRTLYDLLLPHVRRPEAGSARAVAEIIDEVPPAMRTRFRLYLDGVSRRPYAAQMREVVDRRGRTSTPWPRAPQPPEMR
ncbi:hypothetical protein ACP6NG_05435 [Brevibacterium casei]|uniref:hypothetical protein n=1 Tax=Brevibacterium casei TaxID=33889 RepID=UPI003F8233C1